MTTDNPVPHIDVLTTSPATLEAMTIQSKMLMVKDIRDFIGHLKDGWANSGYTDSTIPAADIKKLKMAEKIGIALFNSSGFPQSYWDDSEQELQSAKTLIEQNEDIQHASKKWHELSEKEREYILQKAVNIFAIEQSKTSPVKIIPGQIEWVRDVHFEGNALTSLEKSPDQYKIQLNADEHGRVTKDAVYAIKSALHEQIHIKHANFTYAYYVDQLPMAFNTIAIGLMMQEDAYIPAFRSEPLWAAQLGEREALMANNLDLKFK